MWKAFFLAIGIALCIVGAECLVVERATLASTTQPAASQGTMQRMSQQFGQRMGGRPAEGPRTIIPPEWAPWSLMSAGAVVLLYSITLPKRVSGD